MTPISTFEKIEKSEPDEESHGLLIVIYTTVKKVDSD